MRFSIITLCFKALIFLSFFICGSAAAQNAKPPAIESTFFNNAIYGSLGVNLEAVGEAWFTATAYYERLLQGNAEGKNITPFVKGGFGIAAYWEDSSPYFLGQVGMFTGKKTHHFEASAGLVLSLMEDFDLFPVSGSIGYRLQKPGSHFLLRTGFGWPETFYLGLGVSF